MSKAKRLKELKTVAMVLAGEHTATSRYIGIHQTGQWYRTGYPQLYRRLKLWFNRGFRTRSDVELLCKYQIR